MADKVPVSGLRAPRDNGAVLAEPALNTIPALIVENRHCLARGPAEILGRDFQELRRQARATAAEAAREYLRQAGEPILAGDADSLILAGHQPELFHPGVWVKNFALNRIARENGALPVNLVVDNDIVKSTALSMPEVRVPLPPIESLVGHTILSADIQGKQECLPHVAAPKIVTVPFDQASAETPYEERLVQDEALFASLPDRMETDWGFQPLLPVFWQEVLRQARRTNLLGERVAAARRTLERNWGCHNLELPISRLCRTEPFVWFFAHLLNDLPKFHALYNQTVRGYRRRYGLRSRNHPVPDLAAEGDWLETPFWAWRDGQPRRGRLFACLKSDVILLRVGNEAWPELRRGSGLVESSAALFEAAGYKIRSRALTNTLYARVFLCDLFIHGLGGGKYDELTDDLIRGFYGLEPPGFLVLTATLLLPLPHYPARIEDCRKLDMQLRDLHYNPQRHLDAMRGVDGRVQELIRRKEALIRQPYETIWQREQRFSQLQEVTAQLRAYLQEAEEQTRQDLSVCRQQVQANGLLRNRDFAFCLHPEETLRPFVTQFSARG